MDPRPDHFPPFLNPAADVSSIGCFLPWHFRRVRQDANKHLLIHLLRSTVVRKASVVLSHHHAPAACCQSAQLDAPRSETQCGVVVSLRRLTINLPDLPAPTHCELLLLRCWDQGMIILSCWMKTNVPALSLKAANRLYAPQ